MSIYTIQKLLKVSSSMSRNHCRLLTLSKDWVLMHTKFEYIILDIGTGHWVFFKTQFESILCLQCVVDHNLDEPGEKLSKWSNFHTLPVCSGPVMWSRWNCVTPISLWKPERWGYRWWKNFYPRDAMLAWVIEIATCLSVCPSVCHAPVLCQNEES